MPSAHDTCFLILEPLASSWFSDKGSGAPAGPQGSEPQGRRAGGPVNRPAKSAVNRPLIGQRRKNARIMRQRRRTKAREQRFMAIKPQSVILGPRIMSEIHNIGPFYEKKDWFSAVRGACKNERKPVFHRVLVNKGNLRGTDQAPRKRAYLQFHENRKPVDTEKHVRETTP